jgi:hypothetical protein
MLIMQKNNKIRTIWIWGIVGFGCGLIFILPLFLGIHMSNAARLYYENINMPAIWLAHEWTYVAGFPPYDQLGSWLIVPSIMVLIQWGGLGLLIGLCMSFRGEDRGHVFTYNICLKKEGLR